MKSDLGAAVTSDPRYEPFFDVHLRTGVGIEVFYADRTLETFGRDGADWFWWPRRRRLSPDGPATRPFATSYAAIGTPWGLFWGPPTDETNYHQ